MFRKPTRSKPAVILLIIIGFIVFGNTLKNDYNLDDNYYTNGNYLTSKGFSSIPDIIVYPTFYGPANQGFDYRPLTAISFAIEHQVFGENPTISHLINLLLYILTVVLIFGILQQLLTSQEKVGVAFWISLLFLVHPLHTEVVASIKSRDEILSFLFAVLSWLFALKFSKDSKYFMLFLCILFFGLGMLCKYSLLPFCAIIPLSLYFFRGYPIRKVIFLFVAIVALGLVCHFLKSLVLPPSEYPFSISENGLMNPEFGWYERSATSVYVLGRYLLLHFFPIQLVFYYGYQYVPVVGWGNFFVILSLIFYAYLFFFCIQNWYKRKFIVFGIVTYLVFILVYSNLIELSPGMMAERFCYFSSLGFCIALVGLIGGTAHLSKSTLRLLLPILTLLFSLRSITRNADWKDKDTLYAHDVVVAENSAVVNYVYGNWKLFKVISKLKNAGANSLTVEQFQDLSNNISEAEQYFNKALQINPKDSIVNYSLITCSYQLGNFQEALGRANNAIQKFPTYWDVYFMRGVIESKLFQHKPAVNDFRKVIKNNSEFIPAYEQLSRSLLALGDTLAALEILNLAIEKFPKSPVPYAEMANFYISKGDTTRAISFAEQAASLPPINMAVLQFLSNYFSTQGFRQKSEYYQGLIERHYKKTE